MTRQPMQAISKVEGRVSCIPNNREIHLLLSQPALLYRQPAVPPDIPGQALCIKPTGRLSDYGPTCAQQRGALPAAAQRHLSIRVHGHLGALHRPSATLKHLTGAGISGDDYVHAQNVWETFGCAHMGDYHDLYLHTVLLLADIFKASARPACSSSVAPAHYYTSPGLSWDTRLKKMGVELELLTDCDQHLFIKKGMHSGISMLSKRYAQAINPQVDSYVPSKPPTRILYLDGNNLYGWAMSQLLPTGLSEGQHQVSAHF